MVQSIGLTLNLRSRTSVDDKGGKASKETFKHAFGASYKDQGSGVVLQTMSDGSPIVQAGAQIGDVMIAMGQWQVNSGNLQRLLDNQQTSTVEITLLRQGRIIKGTLPIQSAIYDTVYFTIQNPILFDAWIAGTVTL
jgi:predicted metalloprotease with PDZ domain